MNQIGVALVADSAVSIGKLPPCGHEVAPCIHIDKYVAAHPDLVSLMRHRNASCTKHVLRFTTHLHDEPTAPKAQ